MNGSGILRSRSCYDVWWISWGCHYIMFIRSFNTLFMKIEVNCPSVSLVNPPSADHSGSRCRSSTMPKSNGLILRMFSMPQKHLIRICSLFFQQSCYQTNKQTNNRQRKHKILGRGDQKGSSSCRVTCEKASLTWTCHFWNRHIFDLLWEKTHDQDS